MFSRSRSDVEIVHTTQIDGCFLMSLPLQGKYIWLQRQSSWLYVDMLGVVQGRVDKIGGTTNASWYWWQTARTTDCESDLNRAKRFVEYMIDRR